MRGERQKPYARHCWPVLLKPAWRGRLKPAAPGQHRNHHKRREKRGESKPAKAKSQPLVCGVHDYGNDQSQNERSEKQRRNPHEKAAVRRPGAQAASEGETAGAPPAR